MSSRIDPPPLPAPALVAARVAIDRLVERWDSAEAALVFDGPSLGYSWHAHLGDDFAKLSRDHGHCVPDGALVAHGRLHGSWRLRCDRGAIIFDALMTPAQPARVQAAMWKEELPPDARATRAAERLAGLVARWEDKVAGELFAAAVDRTQVRKTVARIGVDHGTCAIANGIIEIDHEPLGNDQRLRFRLACNDGPVDLTFTLDEAGRISDFGTSPLGPPDATCEP